MRRLSAAISCVVVLATAPAQPALAFTWPQEAARIESRLGSDEVAVRRAAAARLGRLSPALAHPLIVQGLEDPDGEVKLAAARAAISLRVGDLGARVVGWLHERDVRLRLAAVDLLTRDPAPEAIEALGRALADADARVRRGAAAALGEMGRVTREPVEARSRAAAQLMGRLDDRDAPVRIAAVDSLARLGDSKAVLPLVSKLQDGEPEVRVAVVRALGVLGDPRASSALLLAARDRDPQVMAQAVRALGLIGDPAAIPSLIALSQEPNPLTVRRVALTALGSSSLASGVHQARALERLLQSLEDPSLRAASEEVLIRLGAPAAPSLRACLLRAAGDVGAACARALAMVERERAVEPIQRALEQGSLAAGPAIAALGATHGAEAVVVALEHLTHPNPEVRGAALLAVDEMLRARGGDSRAAGPLLAALRGRSWSVDERALLIEALGHSGDPAVVPALEAAASSTRGRVQLAALAALGFVPGHDRGEVLLAALDETDGELRRTAALSLRSTGSSTVAHDLLTRLESREGQDREALALALAGPLSKSHRAAHVRRTAALIDRLSGPARDSALEALASVVVYPTGVRELTRWLQKGSPGDRIKLAEALGLQPGARELVRSLAAAARPSVRATAAWSLGSFPPEEADRDRIAALLRDPAAAVATNAAATVARWLTAFPKHASTAAWQEPLCAALEDERAAVRVNAVVGLFRIRHECAVGSWSRMLRSDPVEAVRAAVVRGLQAVLRDGKQVAEASFELRRCSAFERSRRVADLCDAAASWGGSGAHDENAPSAPARGTAPQLVFVVARGDARTLTSHPFLAQHEDVGTPEEGLIQAGWTDRRGAFAVPAGRTVRLLELSLGRRATP